MDRFGNMRRRFDVDEYYQMAEAGILWHEENVGLIEGEVLLLEKRTPPHAAHVMKLHNDTLRGLFALATISVHGPLRIDVWNEPVPDVLVLARRSDDYMTAHPTPADVHMVIEVVESDLEFTQEIKAPLYARSNIADFWIVDVVADRVLVHRDPVDGRYQSMAELRPGDSVCPLAFPELYITVADILIPRNQPDMSC
jgi:Uma2 family endonuclease